MYICVKSRPRYSRLLLLLLSNILLVAVLLSLPVKASIIPGDIYGDVGVNFDDYAVLAKHWKIPGCSGPGWCDKADIDQSGLVDEWDIAVIADYWLVGQISELSVQTENKFPMRLDLGLDGNLFVTNSKTGSLYIYDPNLNVIGELKDLHKPLSVAVNSVGDIFVGSKGRHDIEVYNIAGEKKNVFGLGIIRMPNDLAIDQNGRIYVCDSENNTIWVFDSNGSILKSIGMAGDGDGQFDFPSAIAIVYRSIGGQPISELYVADQGHVKIQVFDLEGNFLRSIGRKVGSFGGWNGKFVRIQSLTMDNQDRLHVVDSYINVVQILDPNNGSFIDSYGTFGTAAGELKLPLDVVIKDNGQALIANAENGRIEVINVP